MKIKIYKNKDLMEELKILDLGTVKAGESKEVTFYVYNDNNATLFNLSFFLDYTENDKYSSGEINIVKSEVKIITAPKELYAYNSGQLTIEYKPSITLEKGLKVKLRAVGDAQVE